MSERVMQQDDLMSDDSNAIKELKSLYVYFCECSDIHLKNSITMTNQGKRRGGRSSLLTMSQAYGWASEDVALALKKLGHKPPPAPPADL